MSEKWKIIKRLSKKKKTGAIYKVVSDSNKAGYFKHATSFSSRYSGPVAASEYAAFLLGNELSLPVAEIELATIDKQIGVVSLVKTQNTKLYNWNKLTGKVNEPFDHIKNPEGLINMFVFDVWIVNIDRNNRNIILYQTDDGSYDFYLIDHGLSLLSAFTWKRKNEKMLYWDDVANYNNRYLKGLPGFLKKNKPLLYKYAKRIQDMPNQTLEQLTENIPPSLLKNTEKQKLLSFLIDRKKRLPQILERWLIEYKRHKRKKS